MIADLASQIVAACAGPAPELSRRVRDSLKSAVMDPLLLPYVQKPSDPNSYARYLLHEDPQQRFSILSLVWNPGQITPVHGHYFWCGYAVVTGTITEACYAYDPDQEKAKFISTQERPAGYACFHEPGLGIIHRLSNAGAEQAISLHIYGTGAAESRRYADREDTKLAQTKHINWLVEVE